MKLCLISVFPSPLGPVGRALFTWDTTKSWSDISGVPVIFYLRHALFLDREESWGEGPADQENESSQHNTALACVHTGWALIAPQCLCADELSKETDVNWCARRLPVYSCVLDTASSPSWQRYNSGLAIFRQGSVLCKHCWGEGSVLHSCPCPSTL